MKTNDAERIAFFSKQLFTLKRMELFSLGVFLFLYNGIKEAASNEGNAIASIRLILPKFGRIIIAKPGATAAHIEDIAPEYPIPSDTRCFGEQITISFAHAVDVIPQPIPWIHLNM